MRLEISIKVDGLVGGRFVQPVSVKVTADAPDFTADAIRGLACVATNSAVRQLDPQPQPQPKDS